MQRRMLLVGNQSKVAGEEKEVFQLARRAGGDMEKLAELRPAGSGGSFRDVGRHGSGTEAAALLIWLVFPNRWCSGKTTVAA